MTYHSLIIVDSSILVAYYNARDNYHQQARTFFEQCTAELLTTLACVTEVMYLLSHNWRTQNEFLSDLAIELYKVVPVLPEDLRRISELNERYADLPGDFADLSLVAISERLNITAIVTLDSDFDIYRRYRSQPFERILLPEKGGK